MTRQREGTLLCLLSAACYSVAAIFAKLAYAAGVGVGTLLAVRYAVAAVLLWVLVARLRLAAPPAAVARGLALGVFASIQAALYFGALTRMDAAPTSLLLYTYPTLVAVAAVLLGRERVDRRRFAALAVASAGAALVLWGAGRGGAGLDRLGVGLALGSAAVYAAYLLAAETLIRRTPALHLAMLVCAGSALAFGAGGLLGGRLALGFAPRGWLAILALALVSTVLALGAGLAGVARVGPTVNGILMTAEIPLTTALAALVLGERLRPAQLAGGALVLAAVLLLQRRPRPGPTALGGTETGVAPPAPDGRRRTSLE